MEIKEITNDDIRQLIDLYISMLQSIDPKINDFGAINTLVYDIGNKPDYTAIGLYEGDKLIGFTSGYGKQNKLFHFSGIYVIIKNNVWIKKLIDFSFNLIEEKGYSAWQVNATNGNISSIMEKYGAIPKYTKYHKEIH